jgi:hypothetical protein
MLSRGSSAMHRPLLRQGDGNMNPLAKAPLRQLLRVSCRQAASPPPRGHVTQTPVQSVQSARASSSSASSASATRRKTAARSPSPAVQFDNWHTSLGWNAIPLTAELPKTRSGVTSTQFFRVGACSGTRLAEFCGACIHGACACYCAPRWSRQLLVTMPMCAAAPRQAFAPSQAGPLCKTPPRSPLTEYPMLAATQCS